MASESKLQRELSLECAICLQQCMQPVELPCCHIFCFLCAKGTALQSRRCALCRAPIPDDFITKPFMFKKSDTASTSEEAFSQPRYAWYYQGYNGWWQYDDRTCIELEAAFTGKAKSVDVLIAGSVYVIDFENQVQFQRHHASRKRNIKRDLITIQKKGVAGLRSANQSTSISPENDDDSTVVMGPSPEKQSTSHMYDEVDANNGNSSARAQSSVQPTQNERQMPIGGSRNRIPQINLVALQQNVGESDQQQTNANEQFPLTRHSSLNAD